MAGVEGLGDLQINLEDLRAIVNVKGERKIPTFYRRKQDVVEWLATYEFVARSKEWNDERKAINLPAHLQDTALQWYQMKIEHRPEGQAVPTWTQIKGRLTNYFLPEGYDNYLKKRVRERVQKSDESVLRSEHSNTVPNA